jgi:hypothetical protein
MSLIEMVKEFFNKSIVKINIQICRRNLFQNDFSNGQKNLSGLTSLFMSSLTAVLNYFKVK